MKTHSGFDDPKAPEKAEPRHDAKGSMSRPGGMAERKEAREPPAREPSREAVKEPAKEPPKQAAEAVQAQPLKRPAEEKAAQKTVTEAKPPGKEKSVVDVLKEAYNSKIIGKDDYDHALYKLLHKEVAGVEEPVEFKIYKNDGKIEMIVERGEIDIPESSRLYIRKQGGRIVIRSNCEDGKEDDGAVEFGGASSAAVSRQETTSMSPENGEVFTSEDLETIEKEFQSRGTMGDLSVKNETSTLKEDLELIDLRREFSSPEDEKKEAPEEKEAEEPGLLDGILDRVSHLTRKLKEESREEKLARLSMANLGKIKELKEERRAIIGVAYVLKQFLQVRFNIEREVTYHELVDELKGKEMDREIKEQLMEFFRKMPAMMYARVPLNESLPRSYNLAERVIKELSAA